MVKNYLGRDKAGQCRRYVTQGQSASQTLLTAEWRLSWEIRVVPPPTGVSM